MVVTGDRPCLNSNFLVDFGDGKSREPSGGFSEVVFPEFRLGAGPGTPPALPGGSSTNPSDPGTHLVLRRGFSGALDLYDWWDKARKGTAHTKRQVAIQLLAPDLQTVVATWIFHQVRPVALSYSPLRAQGDEVVTETLELAFDKVDMS
jgi:hypothetical protein